MKKTSRKEIYINKVYRRFVLVASLLSVATLLWRTSGLICLDFDGYETNKDLLQEKERLLKTNTFFQYLYHLAERVSKPLLNSF